MKIDKKDERAIREWLINAEAFINGEGNQEVADMAKGIIEIHSLLRNYYKVTLEDNPYNYAHDALSRAKYLPTKATVTIIGTSVHRGNDIIVFLDTDGKVKGDLPKNFERLSLLNRKTIPEYTIADDLPHRSTSNVGKFFLVVVEQQQEEYERRGGYAHPVPEMAKVKLHQDKYGGQFFYTVKETYHGLHGTILAVGDRLETNEIFSTIGEVGEEA